MIVRRERGRWERNGERGRKRKDVSEWRDGGKDRCSWRGERGKKLYCTRCIDFSVDGDF